MKIHKISVKEDATETSARIRKLLEDIPEPNFRKQLREIRTYRVELDSDPTEVGLNSFNGKLAEAQAFKDRVSILLQKSFEVLQDHLTLLAKAKAAQEDAKDVVMLRDDIKELKNQQLREAAARREISEIIDVIGELDRRVEIIKTFQKVCREAYENLKSANDNLSRQVTIVQLMLETGELTSRRKK